MSNARFCSTCGAPLGPNARFCPSCGSAIHPAAAAAPASAAPVQPPPPVPSPQEPVLAILSGVNRRTGFMGLKFEPFVIVFTAQRILFAAQTTEMMKQNVQAARDAAKADGKGFLGQWGAQLSSNSGQQYLSMTPEQILAEQPANFFLPASQLKRIQLREYDDNEGGPTTYTIQFETPSGKHKFDVSNMDTRKRKQQLQQIYGDIIR